MEEDEYEENEGEFVSETSDISPPLYPNPSYGIPPLTGDLRNQDPYDGVSDPLDLILKFVRDDTGQTMEDIIENADLLKDCKKLLLGIWYQFTSQDYVLTNHYNTKVLRRRLLEFRKALLFARAQIPSVNIVSGDYNTIISIMIARFTNRISRGAGGFERISQRTQTQEHISSRKEEVGQLEESGLSSFLGKNFNINNK